MLSKNLLANFKPDDWMQYFAQRVEDLVSTPERRDSFRDLIDDWHMREWIRHFQSNAWERRRKWHERTAWSSKRLQDEKAGPPPKHLSAGHSDWAMDHCELDGRYFWAWMPCEYTLDNKPDTSLPLPFKNRELTVWEECAIIAALHDLVCHNVKPLILKQHSQSDVSGGVKLQDDFLALFKQIPKLTAKDHPALERCLLGVCIHLKVPTPTAAAGEPAEDQQGSEDSAGKDGAMPDVPVDEEPQFFRLDDKMRAPRLCRRETGGIHLGGRLRESIEHRSTLRSDSPSGASWFGGPYFRGR